MIYQIQTTRPTYALRHARVTVCQNAQGDIKILYKGDLWTTQSSTSNSVRPRWSCPKRSTFISRSQRNPTNLLPITLGVSMAGESTVDPFRRKPPDEQAHHAFIALGLPTGQKKSRTIIALPCCTATWTALELLASIALPSIQAAPFYHVSVQHEPDISTLEKTGHFYFGLRFAFWTRNIVSSLACSMTEAGTLSAPTRLLALKSVK